MTEGAGRVARRGAEVKEQKYMAALFDILCDRASKGGPCSIAAKALAAHLRAYPFDMWSAS